MTTAKKIGFTPTWMENEEANATTVPAPLTTIVSEGTEPNLTPAHLDLLGRIKMTEDIITSKGFGKFGKKKKQEFLSELEWLVSINLQLIKSY